MFQSKNISKVKYQGYNSKSKGNLKIKSKNKIKIKIAN